MAVTKLSNSGIKTGVLKYDSMLAGNPAYDPSAFFFIASASPSGTNTVTFSSIPQTYKVLQILVVARSSASSSSLNEDDFYMQFNGDSASNYNTTYLLGEGSGTGNSGNFGGAGAWIGKAIENDSASGNFGVAVVTIEDYTNTTTFKPFRSFLGAVQPVAPSTGYNGRTGLNGGMWRSTSAINSIAVYLINGSYVSGSTVFLYGIKG